MKNIEKIEKIDINVLSKCNLCPRMCGIDRRVKSGVCTVGYLPKVSNIVLHKGEEPPLSGEKGAGAVFFSGCPMKCMYCQNMGFSQKGVGFEISLEELAYAFLQVQKAGATTLDLVTPTPHVPWIVKALDIAKEEGFSLPVVYNTSSYERIDVIKNLDGYVDIYLADIRYTDDNIGMEYSKVPDYWTVAKEAITEMYNQVGPFRENEMRGLIIRILVLPNNVSGHEKAFEFIAALDKNIPVALMSQYIPHFNAKNNKIIGRKIASEEYEQAINKLIELDLDGWMQLDEKERVTTFPINWRMPR